MFSFRKNTRDIGNFYETVALDYLKAHRLTLITQNYLTKYGEIDLIMCDDDLLCFVEVRFRKQSSYGGAEASVTLSKQAKIKKTAEYFLMTNPLYQQSTCRFDVIAITSVQNKPSINWITSAFI